MSGTSDEDRRQLHAVVVDDEPLALDLLRELLETNHGFDVRCFRSSALALAHLRSTPVDVLFLDVRMPVIDGFGLMDGLAGHPIPETVFVTAYEEYALRAFEVAAVDYILKPFDGSRLGAAVARVHRRLASTTAAARSSQIAELLDALRQERQSLRRLPLWSSNDQRAVLVPVESIHSIVAERKRLLVRATDGVFHLRGPLRALTSQLHPGDFVRVNRSTIVNLRWIREVQRWFRGEYVLVLRSGEQLKTSPTYRGEVERKLGLS